MVSCSRSKIEGESMRTTAEKVAQKPRVKVLTSLVIAAGALALCFWVAVQMLVLNGPTP